MSIHTISFPENNGSCTLTKTIDGSTITIEYEYNALTRRHLFTIENEDFKVEKIIGQAGACLNEFGKNICKIFVVLHSVIFDQVYGYQEEFPAGSLQLLLMSYDDLKEYYKNLNEEISSNYE